MRAIRWSNADQLFEFLAYCVIENCTYLLLEACDHVGADGFAVNSRLSESNSRLRQFQFPVSGLIFLSTYCWD